MSWCRAVRQGTMPHTCDGSDPEPRPEVRPQFRGRSGAPLTLTLYFTDRILNKMCLAEILSIKVRLVPIKILWDRFQMLGLLELLGCNFWIATCIIVVRCTVKVYWSYFCFTFVSDRSLFKKLSASICNAIQIIWKPIFRSIAIMLAKTYICKLYQIYDYIICIRRIWF